MCGGARCLRRLAAARVRPRDPARYAPPSRTAAIREPTPPTMPRKQSKSSGDSVAAARPSRRCCAVASECTPKLCVACKLGGLKDVFACRETLGHVAPNWDAPDAGAFFADGAVTAAEAKALADASSVVPDRSAPKKRKAPAAKAKAKAPTAAKASADAPAPPAPRAAPAAKQAKLARTVSASPAPSADSGKAYVSPDAPRADFGVDAPLVFPDLEAIDGRDAGASLRAKELRRGGTPCVLTHVDPRTMTSFARFSASPGAFPPPPWSRFARLCRKTEFASDRPGFLILAAPAAGRPLAARGRLPRRRGPRARHRRREGADPALRRDLRGRQAHPRIDARRRVRRQALARGRRLRLPPPVAVPPRRAVDGAFPPRLGS